jgi:hypothetical protein
MKIIIFCNVSDGAGVLCMDATQSTHRKYMCVYTPYATFLYIDNSFIFTLLIYSCVLRTFYDFPVKTIVNF